MPTPDLDVANLLAAASPAPSFGAVGTSIFRGGVKPASPPHVPHQAIFVLATGGPKPDPYFKVGGASASFYRANVQVRVRANVGDFSGGQARAVLVRTKLHLAQLTGYVRCAVEASHPLWIGRDDTEHDEWTINASLWFKE